MRSVVLTALVLTMGSLPCGGQWFDSRTLESIVLIEKRDGNATALHGTGVLFRRRQSDPILVVTAGHLLRADTLFVSLSADSAFVDYAKRTAAKPLIMGGRSWLLVGSRLRTAVAMIDNGEKVYRIAEGVDLGAFPISIPGDVTADGEPLRTARARFVTPSFMASRPEIRIGADTYFLGFPLGLGSNDPIAPVLRKGAIAWINPHQAEFLIDAVSLGGNSGSPVFTYAGISPDLRIAQSRLVGIVVAHHSDSRLVLQQDPATKRVEMAPLEIENLSLAKAVMAREIIALADLFPRGQD